MSSRVHSLLRASAGTGKTFRLSSRFLELMFLEVDPARVLATTFTRKAAGEILDRVLERLVDAARDEKALAELNDSMDAVTVTRSDCEAMLSKLTRRIDRFKIKTLDAFFVNLAQLFSLDLGMTPGWTILDESSDRQLREEALSQLIEAADRSELVDLLRNLSGSAAARQIRAGLDSAVGAGRGAFLESHAAAWDCFDPGKGFDEARVKAIGETLRTYPIPTTKAGTPAKRWVGAIEKLAAAFESADWKGVLASTVVAKHLEGLPYDRHPIDAEIMQPVAEHAVQQCLVVLSRKNKAIYDFLDQFEAHYDALKSGQAGYRFEDVPARIAPLGSSGFERLSERQLEMWFRLDSRIDHLLLDEFQDTSPVQWRILSNLAEEILGEDTGERSLFVVGDVKQSIYSWREAEPRLLLNLEKRFKEFQAESSAECYSTEAMSKSYRSSRIVLETVNRVFLKIGECDAIDEGPRSEAASEWNENFQEHIAAKPRPGCAYLLQAPDSESSTPEISVLRLAMDRIAAISKEAPHCTVGILLRRNKYISKCINMLRERGIRASGEGGNKLTDSAAVQQMLSVLHLADHPDDTLAAFHVATSPLGAALNLEDDAPEEDRRSLARNLRLKLAENGYGATLSEWVARCDPHDYSDWDHRRLAQLVDLAFSFDAEANLRPSTFVKFVQAESVEDPSSARVKVMTVHASKGLEFDVVVLPELSGKPFLRSAIVSARDDENLTAPLAGVSSTAGEALMKSNPELEALWRAGEQTNTHEFLSVLYVAMTRAVHRLEMVLQPPPKESKSMTAASILREMLEAGEPDEDGVLWAHPENDAAWFPAPKKSAEVSEQVTPVEFKLPGGARSLSRKSPSSHEATGTVNGARLLEHRPALAATRGLLFHRWYEEIEWLEEFTAGDEHLVQLGLRIEYDEALVRSTLADFRSSLELPEIQTLLTRGSRDITAVWRERDFSLILPDDDGRDVLWNGTFDRVVLTPDTAEIIDFKTDQIDADQVAARAASHAPQLAAYERVLERMLGSQALRIERKLAFVHPGVVTTLS